MNNSKSRVYTSYIYPKRGDDYKVFSTTKGTNASHKGCGLCGGKNLPKK